VISKINGASVEINQPERRTPNAEYRVRSSEFGVRLSGILAVLCVLALAFLGCGCAASVYPPAKLIDPVPIYLAEYNVHSTVLFPHDGKYIDYSFGDWNYAALHHKFINDAIGALTISGEATFEKRTLEVDPKTGEPILNDNPGLVIRLYAERTAVEKRYAELTKRFDDDVKIHREDGMMVYGDNAEIFVKDDQHYSIVNNCNHVTADSLRALGFRVDGPVMSNQFHLCRPQEPPATPQAQHAEAVVVDPH
jgi:hypothetical protein